MRALLVHNDNAGTDPVPRAEIEAVLREAGIETAYCSHGEDDLAEALAKPFDLIVAAGGDGTVADVVSTLEAVERPIGILPMGGSNNIANSLRVDGDWRDIPRRWSINRWTRLDRCEADGPWGLRCFVEAIGSGVLTDSFEQVDDEPDTPEEKRANGRKAFRQALGDAEPFACRIETDNWSWQGECLMIELMNLRYVGARLALAGDAPPDDGMLDIVLVTPDQREMLCRWAEDPDAAPCPMGTRRAAEVRLVVKDRPFRLDDRSPNENLTGMVAVRIRGNPVRVLTPNEDRA